MTAPNIDRIPARRWGFADIGHMLSVVTRITRDDTIHSGIKFLTPIYENAKSNLRAVYRNCAIRSS